MWDCCACDNEELFDGFIGGSMLIYTFRVVMQGKVRVIKWIRRTLFSRRVANLKGSFIKMLRIIPFSNDFILFSVPLNARKFPFKSTLVRPSRIFHLNKIKFHCNLLCSWNSLNSCCFPRRWLWSSFFVVAIGSGPFQFFTFADNFPRRATLKDGKIMMKKKKPNFPFYVNVYINGLRDIKFELFWILCRGQNERI